MGSQEFWWDVGSGCKVEVVATVAVRRIWKCLHQVLNAAKTASSRARCSNAVGLKGHKVQGQMLGMLQVLSQGLQELKARYSLQDSICPNLSSAILHARRVSSVNFCFRSLSVLFNQASPFLILAFKIDHCFFEGVLWRCPKKYATDLLDFAGSKDVCWSYTGTSRWKLGSVVSTWVISPTFKWCTLGF